MKNKLTKIEMIRAIFFVATEGKRTPENYPEGMYIIETLGNFYYRWRIEKDWAEMVNGKTTAGVILRTYQRELMFRGIDNTSAARVAQAINSITK